MGRGQDWGLYKWHQLLLCSMTMPADCWRVGNVSIHEGCMSTEKVCPLRYRAVSIQLDEQMVPLSKGNESVSCQSTKPGDQGTAWPNLLTPYVGLCARQTVHHWEQNSCKNVRLRGEILGVGGLSLGKNPYMSVSYWKEYDTVRKHWMWSLTTICVNWDYNDPITTGPLLDLTLWDFLNIDMTPGDIRSPISTERRFLGRPVKWRSDLFIFLKA